MKNWHLYVIWIFYVLDDINDCMKKYFGHLGKLFDSKKLFNNNGGGKNGVWG
jgi:hypothetical protein